MTGPPDEDGKSGERGRRLNGGTRVLAVYRRTCDERCASKRGIGPQAEGSGGGGAHATGEKAAREPVKVDVLSGEIQAGHVL